MNRNLQALYNFFQESSQLTADEKAALLKSVKDVDKELEIALFKLDRTEKVKKTTAILLEETIEELEQKRKAVEVQNRELEIEGALERVRTVAMGMRRADDMLVVCRMISDQLQLLHVTDIRNVQTAIIDEGKGTYINYQYFTPYQEVAIEEVDYNKHPKVLELVLQLQQSADAFFSGTFVGEELEEWRQFRKDDNQFPDPILEEATAVFYYFYSIGQGGLGISAYTPLNEEDIHIFKRFRNVFDLAYRRFIDIEQAEAQAREAKIEASLERVRSRAMAMQNSSELAELVATVFTELTTLDFAITSSIIWIHNPELNLEELWAASPEINTPAKPIHLKSFYHPFFKSIIHGWKEKDQKWIYELTGIEKQNFQDLFFEDVGNLPEALKTALTAHEKVVFSASFNNFGALEIIGIDALTDENFEILHRFGKVFDSSYTRFNDLKLAEAQAREAKIEAALERVRSRTMGMQKSEELKEVIRVVYDQFVHLNILIEHTGFILDYKARDDMHIWLADQHEVPSQVTIPYFDCAHWNSFKEAKEKGIDFFANHLTFEEKNRFYQDLFKLIPGLPEEAKEYYFSCPGLAISTVLLENIGLYIENFSGISYSDEENITLMRFGKVFQQTYTRFLDLQKAEAQAREAQIEAALERVRSKAMAMQKSDDLAKAVSIVFEQLDYLDLGMMRCGIGILDNGSRSGDVWYTIKTEEGSSSRVKNSEPMDVHPLLSGAFDAWLRHEDFSYVLQDEDLIQYYNTMDSIDFRLPEFQQTGSKQDGLRQYYHMANFQAGALFAFRASPFTDEAKQVLRRFADVFNQTYTRFLDLQKAEAQAREAQIEVAVERVRAKALAMHKSEELHSVVVTLKKEMMGLRIPDITAATMYLAQNDGSIRVLDLSDTGREDDDKPQLQLDKIFRLEETDPDLWIRRMWNCTENYFVLEADEADFVRMVQWIRKEDPSGAVIAEKIIREKSIKKAWLPTVKLEKGRLNIDLLAPPTDEIKHILLKMGAGFDLAYKRFLDLKQAEQLAEQAELDLIKLKEEKIRTDNALAELKATQSQLIQSEKLASLGELTAGIAHEIQNPLNFVNNFSEVNAELIDELNIELAIGNMQSAKEIGVSIKDNEEKILFHGKRADAIVKGMLQHSRASSGQKEPTDINALADEYLRLAYHGLRAKDKSFNAIMKTDFDETIGMINVIPQDIGRVVLNLITNAFYAVTAKASATANVTATNSPKGKLTTTHFVYQPTVTVITKMKSPSGGSGAKVEISVKDNGPGIPQKELDKIFQPFFTTKPVGQGTGLGLSISYDIIKAHGGELKVETIEGEGTTFSIQLPIS